jgi:hypothetical protein
MGFLRNAFNLLLLVALAVGMVAVATQLMREPGVDQANVAWAREWAGALMAGVLTLVTAKVAGKREP